MENKKEKFILNLNNKTYIPLAKPRSIFCIKCGNFAREMDENGLCQKCFYEEVAEE